MLKITKAIFPPEANTQVSGGPRVPFPHLLQQEIRAWPLLLSSLKERGILAPATQHLHHLLEVGARIRRKKEKGAVLGSLTPR